jgi:MFS family permease
VDGNRTIAGTITTDIPARLDRLPWSRFHLLVVVALGITWVLDGLEVTIVGGMGGALQDPKTLHLSATDIGSIASAYVIGAVVGALVFGWLTDRIGRKRMFFITLAVYLLGVLLSAFSWSFASLAVFRLITGLGIGGEYSAINSAIDELMPARLRGRIDLIVNGSFWIGAALGSGVVTIVLDPHLFPIGLGWRFGFGIGAALGCIVLLLRRWVPESPRWLLTHGYAPDAERNVTDIERRVGIECRPHPDATSTFHPQASFGLRTLFRTLFVEHRSRTILVLVLMASQAFLYNAIFFTLGLVLTKFYGVPADAVGSYILPFAAGNFLGPLLLGRWFDTIGRRINDRRHLYCRGYRVGGDGVAVRAGPAVGERAGRRVERDFLFRLRGRQRRVSVGGRTLSFGDPRAGHRGILCRRHGRWRRHRPLSVRPAHRYRLSLGPFRRLPVGCGPDADRCPNRDWLGRRCGRKITGNHRAANFRAATVVLPLDAPKEPN